MKIVEVVEFSVIGRAVRTSNAREMTGDGLIPGQWARAPFGDGAIIAVYTDYESDLNGAYTHVLGVPAVPDSRVPEGMVSTTVPGGRYAVFTSARGPVQKVVVETWMRIHAELPTETYRRTYVADYEAYDERAADPADAVVDIYVGIHVRPE